MAEVLRHSASYVFILALGYFLKRVGVFGKQDYKVLTKEMSKVKKWIRSAKR